MTTLPDLEPAALEAAHDAYEASQECQPREHSQALSEAIRAYLSAARSTAPEARKAVDAVTIPEKLANNLYRFLLQLSTAAVTLRGLHGDITGNAHLYAEALKAAFDASVPAPSGAERLGREFEDAWDKSTDKLYETDGPQAVPAEDVASTVGSKIEALLSEERQGAFIGSHQVHAIKEIEAQIAAALAASEAEAISLRRKLEEAERDNALKLCSLADTMTACRGDDDFIAGVRAKIEAALSTEPGEPEGHTVEISRMGWEEDEGEQRFTATAVFKEPPNWPFNVVWKRIPVRMALAAPLPEDIHHGR
jgi:hypothetical protein